VGSATEEVKFLERRVATLREQADETALRVREFQEKHQVIDLDAQAKALVSSAAELHRQRIEKQVELDYARGFSSPDEATVRQLGSQKAAVEHALRELEEMPTEAGSKHEPAARAPQGDKRVGMFPPALQVPRLRAEFEKLYRERKVAEASLIFALERLESAKASEAREVSTFQVLDPATVPTRKSRPRGTLVVIQMASLCFFGAMAFELFRANRKVRTLLPENAP
jgi:capsule polysaccharide export protein KpsE/RkpR